MEVYSISIRSIRSITTKGKKKGEERMKKREE